MYLLFKFLLNLLIAILVGGGLLCIFIILKNPKIDIFSSVTLIPLFFFLIPGLALAFRKSISKAWRKIKAAKKQSAKERRERSWAKDPERREAYYKLHCWLESGLPLVGGTLCTVCFDGDALMIEGGGMSFSVAYSKVSNMRVQSSTETEHYFVSSAGDAVAGAINYGAAGARYGGRIQHQTIENTSLYLVVTYIKQQRPASLLFKLMGSYDRRRIENIIEEKQDKISKGTFHMEL